MMKSAEITSIDDPRIEPFRSMRGQKTTFIVEGEKCVQSLFESDVEIVSLFIESRYLDDIPNKYHSITYTAKSSFMAQITGYRLHQGIMACAMTPPLLSIEALQESALFLQGLANAENVGALVRVGRALGFSHFIVDRSCSPPYLRRSVKTAMGAQFGAQFYDLPSHSHLETLRERGFSIVAADPGKSNTTLQDWSPGKKTIVIFGSEGHGVAPEVLEQCSERVAIPIARDIDSLNVVSAASIILYHWTLKSGRF